MSTCNSSIRGDVAGDWRGGEFDNDAPLGDGVCCRVVVITDMPVEFCQRVDDAFGLPPESAQTKRPPCECDEVDEADAAVVL